MTVAEGTLRAHEPALQLVLSVRAEPSRQYLKRKVDVRQLLVERAAAFVDLYVESLATTTDGSAAPAVIADDDWPLWRLTGPESVHQRLSDKTRPLAPDELLLHFRIQKDDSASARAVAASDLYLYAFGDALVLHIALARYDPWSGTLADGWNELRSSLARAFEGEFVEAAANEIYGASLLYWASAMDDAPLAAYATEAASLAAVDQTRVDSGNANRTRARTELGLLWHGTRGLCDKTEAIAQDTWVLVSAHGGARDEEIGELYFEPGGTFIRAVLSYQKFRSRQLALDHNRLVLAQQEAALDDAAEHLLNETAGKSGSHVEALTDFRSHHAEVFQGHMRQTAHNLARYRGHLSELKRIRETLELARRNFLLNCAELLSATTRRRIALSDSPPEEASRALHGWHAEQLGNADFILSELGDMRSVCDQLDADLQYAEWIIERGSAALQSGTELLQIAGYREQHQINHHIAVDSAAVVATLVAFVVVEGLLKPLRVETQLLAIGSVLSLASLSFTALVWRARGRHPKDRLTLGGLVISLALTIVTLIMGLLNGGEEANKEAGLFTVLVVITACIIVIVLLAAAHFRRPLIKLMRGVLGDGLIARYPALRAMSQDHAVANGAVKVNSHDPEPVVRQG